MVRGRGGEFGARGRRGDGDAAEDITVEEEGEEFSINTNTDNQLNYAIKLFAG